MKKVVPCKGLESDFGYEIGSDFGIGTDIPSMAVETAKPKFNPYAPIALLSAIIVTFGAVFGISAAMKPKRR